MEFRVLGPLEVRRDGTIVELPGGKPRAVLAFLLLHANEPVSAERLAVALWGEDAPASAVRTVQVYVSRLRRALGEHELLTSSRAGYLLRVRAGELDLDRFERLVEDGRRALAHSRAAGAGDRLREALGLWRGPALCDLGFESFAQAEIARLEEHRLAALEVRVEADLAAGRHAELVPELQRLVAEYPLRERLHGKLMLALYRSGRQADALAAYRHAREVLVERLGIEPGNELQQLQGQVLAHDPAADAPRATRGGPSGDVAAVSVRAGGPSGPGVPAPPNRTIGRGDDVRALVKRLRVQSVRLLTLTGPGGVGKTRLALEVARAVEADFAGGACFVSLAGVRSAEGVPAAIVKTLGITVLADESPARAVERFLAAKHVLVVADNFEHLLPAARWVGHLLAACPSVTVLATSREPLCLNAEVRYPVSPLPVPDVGAALMAEAMAADAVALFVERARAHDPAFRLDGGDLAAVADICRRVDGLPLAIELAAARCDLLSPREIADRLDRALDMLGTGPRDAPPRHKTLHSTIDWSHDLLTRAEATCFARFAIFAGGATVEAAEAITGGGLQTLDHLVAKSLLVRQRRGRFATRLSMLETVRAYAGQRLAAAADRVSVNERHYDYYLALAHRHGSDRALAGPNRSDHLVQLDADVDNLRAALGWAAADGSAERTLAMIAALGPYWLVRGRHTDAVHAIDQALAMPAVEAYPALVVEGLLIKVWCLWPLGHGDAQPSAMAQAESIARRLGDPPILSRTLQVRAAMEAGVGRLQSEAGRRLRRSELAKVLADEALQWAQAAGDEWEIAHAAAIRARAAPTIDELGERLDRAAALLAQVGDHYHLAQVLSDAAYAALCAGSERKARDLIDRAMPIARELDDPQLWMFLRGNLGQAALLAGDTDLAEDALRDELRLCRDLVFLPIAFEGLRSLAGVAAARGDTRRAARLAGAAAAHRYGQPEDPVDLRIDATWLEPARINCEADAWLAGIQEGARLDFEAAIAYAIGGAA